MEPDKLQPIPFKEFTNRVQLNVSAPVSDYKEHFQQYIKNASDFAIGPYFWFIPDNISMDILAVSVNIKVQTGYSDKEWTKVGERKLFPSLIHPEDRQYVLAAIQELIMITEKLSKLQLSETKFFVYCRFLNAKKKYRWTVFQFPAFLFADNGRAISAFILISDISHLSIMNAPLMTVIDKNEQIQKFYKITTPSPLDIPSFKITKRETEIIQLMAQGLNTPQLAKHLFLSYNTIENHKKNLRRKTGAKTSVEMMNIVGAIDRNNGCFS